MKIAIMNQKGGATKTEVANVLMMELSKTDKVTGMDADAQGDLSKLCEVYDGKSLVDIIRNAATLEDISTHVSDNLKIVRSGNELSALDIEVSTRSGAEIKLLNTLNKVTDSAEITIFDCPPAYNRLTSLIIAISDYVIIPVVPEVVDSVDGYVTLRNNIKDVTEAWECSEKKIKVLVSKYNKKRIADRRNLKTLLELNPEIFRTYIRESTAVSRARAEHMTIIEYDEKNNAAIDFTEFVKEVREDMKIVGDLK